jgi:hypothetical protein
MIASLTGIEVTKTIRSRGWRSSSRRKRSRSSRAWFIAPADGPMRSMLIDGTTTTDSRGSS